MLLLGFTTLSSFTVGSGAIGVQLNEETLTHFHTNYESEEQGLTCAAGRSCPWLLTPGRRRPVWPEARVCASRAPGADASSSSVTGLIWPDLP